MKKIIVVAVVLLSALFYFSVNSFEIKGIIQNDGLVFSDNQIQEKLYAGSKDEIIEPISVCEDDTIYERWGNIYVGESKKESVSTVYPTIIEEGQGFKFMDYGNDIIDEDFETYEGYEGMIINDGKAYDVENIRSDYNNYLFARLTNGLYINTQEIQVRTIANEYTIPVNSFIYFTPNYIHYAYYNNGTYITATINDVQDDTIISFDDFEVYYNDLLLVLGEITISEESESSSKTEEETKNNGSGSDAGGSSGYVQKASPNKRYKDANIGSTRSSSEATPATKAQEPEKADGSLEPEPAKEREKTETEKKKKYQEWVKPEVTLKSFNVNVYTVEVQVDVNDPSNVISNGLTYEIIFNEGLNKGGIDVKRTIIANYGINNTIIGGLTPDTEYIIKAYYNYYDEFGKMVNETVYFLKTTEFRTKTLSELGTAKFVKLKNDEIFSNRVQINDISIDWSTSSADAVEAISRIVLVLTDEKDNELMFNIPANGLNTIKGKNTYTFATPNSLDSGETFDAKLVCYDSFNNVLEIGNNTFETRTCKSLPQLTVEMKKPSSEAMRLTITKKVENSKTAKYSNLRFVLTDVDGNTVKVNGNSYLTFDSSNSILADNLGLNSKYVAHIIVDADINDGNGVTQHELYAKSFNTASFADLGELMLEVKDISSEECSNETYRRAVLSLSINDSTNEDLARYIDSFSISLKGSKGDTLTYVLSQQEMYKLLIMRENLVLDTLNFLPYSDADNNKTYLKSDSRYTISYRVLSDELYGSIEIPVSKKYIISSISTPKTPISLEIKRLAYTGYIHSEIILSDPDNVIEGSQALLRVVKIEGKETTLVGSFRIDKNTKEANIIDMMADASKSTGGISYDITEGTYEFRMYADQAYVNNKLRTNYMFYNDSFETILTVGAEVYLTSLGEGPKGLPEGYTELKYLKMTNGQYFDADFIPNQDTRIDMKVSVYNTANFVENAGFALWGSAIAYNNRSFECYSWNNSFEFHYGGQQKYSITPTVGQVYEISLNKNVLTIDGVLRHTYSYSKSSGPYSLWIGSINRGGSATRSAGINLYSCQIYDNGKLVRDFVPCMDSTGECGLYDLANGKFYRSLRNSFDSHDQLIIRDVENYDRDKQYVANFNIDVTAYLDSFGQDALKNKTIYYKITNNYKRTSEIGSVQYESIYNEVQSIPVSYAVDKNSSYTIEVYALIDDSGSIKVDLDKISFTTESEIRPISTWKDFLGIGSSSLKYVVINDLVNPETGKYPSSNSDRAQSWNSSAASFNAHIDFQGFSLYTNANRAVIGYTGKNALIENVVFKTHVPLSYTSNSYGRSNAGTFVLWNYGTIRNIYSEVTCEQYPYMYSTYWTTEPYKQGVPQYGYRREGGSILLDNYGLIENFVINLKDNYFGVGYTGLVGSSNASGGITRNGYLYSSETEDNKANFYIYGSYEEGDGAILSSNSTGGIIENVFALANVYLCNGAKDRTGIVCGNQLGTARNCYSVGSVTVNGNPTTYGPTIGYTTTSYVNKNIFCSSPFTYKSTNSTTFNTPASILAMRNATWQNSVLNATSKNFNVDELIAGDCYPQVIYSSDCMPAQDKIPLAELTNYSEKDLVYAYTYVMGTDAEKDAIFAGKITDGKEVWDPETDDEDEIHSDIQPVIFLISDNFATPVQTGTQSILSTQITIDVLGYDCDGHGITTVYALAYNPEVAKNSYTIDSVQFIDIATGVKSKKTFSVIKYLSCEFYRDLDINDVDEWRYWMVNEKTRKLNQNYKLVDDIDFDGAILEDVMVNGTYTGTFDGQGHTISNINYSDVSSAAVGGTSAITGLFSKIQGTVQNLTIENVYFEGGKYAGVLAGHLDGATIRNVFINDCYVGGSNYVGGFAGYATASTSIIYSGITDTKIVNFGGVTTNTYDGENSHAGGFVGITTSVLNITNSYGQNLYIENLIKQRNSASGGFIGSCEGGATSTKVANSYVTGVINSSGIAAGGMIGSSWNNILLENCYADVDINSYSGNAGGICGRALDSMEVECTNCLTFGNINAAVIFDGENESRNFFDNICYDATYCPRGYYYDNAVIYSKGTTTLNKNINDTTEGHTPVSASIFDSYEYRAYLNQEVFTIEDGKTGIYPKLMDASGNIMPGQKDEYVSEIEETSPILLKEYRLNGNSLEFYIIHDEDITINGVYNDYTYVNKASGVKNNGANSLTRKEAFKSDSIGIADVTADMADEYGTERSVARVTYYNVSYNCFYDIYKATAIEYEKDGVTNYLKVNSNLDCFDQQYKEISNADGWNTYVKNSYAENFRLTGDIDFGGGTYHYDAEDGTNVLVNRLVGNKTAKYDDIYNGVYDGINELPYFTVGNINITSSNNDYMWVYNSSDGLIRYSLSEISNISFDKINITSGTGCTGVISGFMGKIQNVTFTDCNVSSGPMFSAGMISTLTGTINNVYVGNSSVQSSGWGSGILTGTTLSRWPNTKISNVIIEESKITTSNAYTGGVLGYDEYRSYYYSTSRSGDGTSLYIDNSILENVTITTSGEYCGGIIGYASEGIRIRNDNISNLTINSTHNRVGGVGGYVYGGNTKIQNVTVYNSTLIGNSYVGGITGQEGDLLECIVQDTLVIGKSERIGGLIGYNSGTAELVYQSHTSNSAVAGWVENCKVYGNSQVGGLIGHCNSTTGGIGFVDNCEIYGNTKVGGAVGEVNNGSAMRVPYISNSIITGVPANSYGVPTATSRSYFGGITGLGGRSSGFVDNCIIGDNTVDYVGGLQGYLNYYNGADTDAISRDCVVIGNNYVGGLFGWVCAPYESTSYKVRVNGDYSNAKVVGNNYVAGIAGRVDAFKISNKNTYVNMPVIEYCHFTGSLTSKNTASAIFGIVIGNNTNMSMAGLVSMPSSIVCSKFEPIVIDGTSTVSSYAYNWKDVEEETSNMKISLWGETELTTSEGTTTMAEFLYGSEKYNKHIGTIEEVTADFTGYKLTAAKDRKFIYLYEYSYIDESTAIPKNRSIEIDPEYTQVEYITSTGTQMINTGIKVDHKKKNEFEVTMSIPTSGRRYLISGAYPGGNAASLEVNANNTLRVWDEGDRINNGGLTLNKPFTFKATIEPGKSTLTYNNVTYTGSALSSGTSGYGMRLFNDYRGGTSTFTGFTLYGYKHTVDGEVVCDLVPVVDSNGEAGLYDVVSKKFLKNVGTGKFVAGKEIVDPDPEYNYIVNNIGSFSLSGASYFGKVCMSYTYENNIVNEEMPYAMTQDPLTTWLGITHKSRVNYFTGDVFENNVRQGVPIPGTDKYYENVDKLDARYENFLRWKDTNDSYSLDDLKTDEGLGTAVETVDMMTAYLSDANVINLDIAESEYSLVEYVSSNGNPYLNTGIKGDAKIVLDIQFTSSSDRSLMGMDPSGNYFGKNANNKYELNWQVLNVDATKRHILTANFEGLNSLSAEGQTITNGYGPAAGNEIQLFALTGSWRGVGGKLYSCQIYKSGVKVRDFVPVYSNTRKKFGLYDLVSNTFFTAVNGDFSGGEVIGNLNLCTSINVKESGTDNILYSIDNIDRTTYSLESTMTTNLDVEMNLRDGSIKKYRIKIADLLRKTTLEPGGSIGYYIEPKTRYIYMVNGNTATLYNKQAQFVNLYNGKAVDDDGFVWDLTDNSKTSITNRVLDNSNPLYSFSVGLNGKKLDYYTYGTYTFIKKADSSDVSNDYRYMLKNGRLIILRDSLNACVDDYFYVNDSYEAYLKKDGSIKSIGTVDLVNNVLKKANSSFKNKNIKSMASNINGVSGLMMLEYKNGDIEIYNIYNTSSFISVKAPMMMSMMMPGATVKSNENEEPSLLSFFMTGIRNLVTGVNEEETVDTAEKSNEAKNLVSVMMSSGMNLKQVLNVTSQTKDIETLVNSDYLNELEGNIVGTNDGSSEIGVEAVNGDEIIESGELEAKEKIEIILPKIEGVTYNISEITDDTTTKEYIVQNTLEDQYITSYNEETGEFDIYSAEELLENPEDPVSENNKVVDMSTLKSLYSALGEKEHDTGRGIRLYILIAIAIACLSGIIYILGLKKKYNTD